MNKILKVIKQIYIEIYVFINCISITIPVITTTLLLQDKFCRVIYNQTAEFCINFTKIKPEQDPHNIKSQILKSTLNFGYYSSIIQVLPSVFWLLFMGSWIDRYNYGRKVVLSLSCIGSIADLIITSFNAYFFTLNPYLMLLNSVTSTIVGGFMSSMVLYSYVTMNSSPKNRALRFSFLEFIPAFGKPLGTFIGGQLLLNTPNGINGQLHNYNIILMVAIFAKFANLLLILLFVEEKSQKSLISDTDDNDDDDDNSGEQVNNNIDNNTNHSINTNYNSIESRNDMTQESQRKKWYYPLKLLFDLNNIKDMWKCVTKKRPDNIRLRIWLLFLLYAIVTFIQLGAHGIYFQFVEKVYGWNAVQYSVNSAIASTIEKICLGAGIIAIITLVRVCDSNLIIIGGVAIYLRYVIFGSYLAPIGFYAGTVFGSIGNVCSIGLKSMLSKFVLENELGKFFSLLTIIESFFPLISNSVFITIFTWTIDYTPGLIFEISAVLLLIPLIANMWVEVKSLNNT